MLGSLVPCGGGDPIPLVKPKLVVGRSSQCDVPLQYSTISSQHCVLTFKDGLWYVRDLASRNGIKVNAETCVSKCLMPNDVLSIAKYRFQVAYKVKGDTPLPATQPVASQPSSAWPSYSPPSPGSSVARDPRLVRAAARGLTPNKSATAPAAGSADVATIRKPVYATASLGKLIPCGGGDPILLTKPKILIGRKSECDIVLPYSTISSAHCSLRLQDGFWFVRDLGSRNGIKVDGIQQQSKYLMPGQVLWVGKYRFEISYTPPKDAQPPLDADVSFSKSLLQKAGLEKHFLSDEPPKWLGKDDDEPKERLSLDDL